MLKVHLSLPVTDLAATEVFYSTLFDAPPSKAKPDYLKFEPDALALNISFVQVAAGHLANIHPHLGIQFPSQRELDVAFERLSGANLVARRERSICCYADQDKFWVRDPDGHEWELYYLVSDSDTKIQAGGQCCETDAERSVCC